MDDENNKKVNGCKPFAIGCFTILLIVVLALIYLFISVSDDPDGGVLINKEIEEYALEYIEEHNILNENEEIIAYYDYTLELDSTEAAILTNERIIYHNNKLTESFNLTDIIKVSHRYESFEGDIIEVVNKDGKPLKIEIAPLNGGESFYNALIGILKSKGIQTD